MPPNWHALTGKAPGIANVLTSSCDLCAAFDPANPPNPLPPTSSFLAVWDTGATNSVITQAVIDACGLKPIGMTQSHGVHGVSTVEVFLVNLRLPNAVGFPGLQVTRGDLGGSGSDVLIGMDIISQGDFAVTNHGGVTVFSFRIPSQGHVDYVAMHQAASKPAHGGSKKNRPPKKKGPGGKGKKRR